MVEGHQRDTWDAASAIIASIYNSQRTKDPLSPAKFNPFMQVALKSAPKQKSIRHLAMMMGCKIPDEEKKPETWQAQEQSEPAEPSSSSAAMTPS